MTPGAFRILRPLQAVLTVAESPPGTVDPAAGAERHATALVCLGCDCYVPEPRWAAHTSPGRACEGAEHQ